MSLYSGSTYWNKAKLPTYNFEKLKNNIKSDVLIVGAGMSGSLCAYVLSRSGIKVTVIEKDKIGNGSSSANTGLLQYSSDKRISEFARDIGEEKAVLFYKMCLEAMDSLTKIVSKLDGDTEYRLRDSINYASKLEDKEKLLKDLEYLEKYDFPVEYLNNKTLKEKYNIDKAAALKTWHDAEVNPFKLIQELTKKNIEQGVTYYENTEIEIDAIINNLAPTVNGFEINFESIILTTGYSKIYPVIEDKCLTYRTYAFTSAPIKSKLWKDNAMIWETNMPYYYFRGTTDNRIIGGGLDEDINELEFDEKKINEKTQIISKEIENIFPYLDIDIEYSWNALFYGSKDGLPFIGRDPENANKYYLLGYEGNGTCYSVAGAFILNDIIQGKENIYEDLLRVDR